MLKNRDRSITFIVTDVAMFRSDRLAWLMESRDISQSELARRLNVSQTTIWKLVTGPVQGSKHTHKIARELGTSSAYLMDETDNPDPNHVVETFTSEERAWVNAMKILPPNERAALLTLCEGLRQKAEILEVREN